VGGLGNQLFIYAAAKALSEKNGSTLVLDANGVGPGKTNHGVDILPYVPISDDVTFSSSYSPCNQFLRRTFLGLIHSKFTQGVLLTGHFFRSSEVGFDSQLLDQPSSVYVEGYFQSWKYFKMLKDPEKLLNTKIDFGSEWFTRLRHDILSATPVVIHVRRGDYLSEGNRFGCLGVKYYLAALDALPSKFSDSEVWMFTDSPDDVGDLKYLLERRRVRVIRPPSNSHPMESLILMSQSKALVIGNSTFSFWAALLAGEKASVVAPAKWFKGMADPKDLLPETWARVTSYWTEPHE